MDKEDFIGKKAMEEMGAPTINRVGLKNVQDRIRLNYGPEYGLTIASGPSGGTVVTFRLPRTR